MASDIKIWDRMGGTVITRLSPAASLCMSGGRACLVSGYLATWPGKTGSGRQVYNKPCPVSVMAGGVGHKDKTVVVGALCDLVQGHKRKEEPVEENFDYFAICIDLKL